MTILFAGSGADAFGRTTAPNEITLDSGSNRFDSDFSDGAMSIGANGIAEADFTAQTDLWLHFTFASKVYASSQTSYWCYLLDSADDTEWPFSIRVDNGQLGFRYTPAGTLTAIGSLFTYSTDTMYTIDIHFVMHASAGSVDCYVDEVLVASVSGVDTVSTGTSQIDLLRFNALDIGKIEGTNWADACISEVIVSTTDTRGMRVATLSPTGAGTTGAWTGAYTDVDELVGFDDADYIASNTNAQVTTFAMSNLSVPAATQGVLAVVECFRGHAPVGAITNIQHAMRSGSTDYFSSSVSGLDSEFVGYYNVREVDPDTATDWTSSGVDALELGVKAIT